MNHREKRRAEEIVSMEEYLEKRQEKKKSQVLKRGCKGGTVERQTALELALLFI